MEETREQPIIMPATALNQAEEIEKEISEESAVSEIGSQPDALGKFKSVQALMDAYNSLQAEFTKKCQALSELKKDKIDEKQNEIDVNKSEVSTEFETEVLQESNEDFNEESFSKFLLENSEAGEFAEEIKQKFSAKSQTSPYEVAWANVLIGKLKQDDSDKIINQYVLSNENVKNKIIESYLKELSATHMPKVLSSQSGERVSGVVPEAPKTLKDAKALVDKMFS